MIRPFCDKCEKEGKIFKLFFRYTDEFRTYTTSQKKIIHTDYMHLCKKCLEETVKLIKNVNK